jgi:ActR/RegA family two-component response regulator
VDYEKDGGKAMTEWIAVNARKPPDRVVVETKIDDEKGLRNVQNLNFHHDHRLWFCPDDSMYVYYVPTHWRPL